MAIFQIYERAQKSTKDQYNSHKTLIKRMQCAAESRQVEYFHEYRLEEERQSQSDVQAAAYAQMNVLRKGKITDYERIYFK